MILYADSSALVKLLVEEPFTDDVRRAVDAASLVATSVVAYPEIRSALGRRYREGGVSDLLLVRIVAQLDADWQGMTTIDVEWRIAGHAGELAHNHALRGFDAVHLACANRLRGTFDDVRFLTYDERLEQAAHEEGFAAP